MDCWIAKNSIKAFRTRVLFYSLSLQLVMYFGTFKASGSNSEQHGKHFRTEKLALARYTAEVQIVL